MTYPEGVMHKETKKEQLLNAFSNEEGLELLFLDLFRSYEQSLYVFSLKMTKDDALSKDIVQEVFIKLWEIRGQMNEIEHIDRFLYKLTQNKVLDFLRKAASDSRLKQVVRENMNQVVQEQPTGLEQKEYHAIINKAIEMLPEKRKAVYLLKDDGLNYRQIADKMDISTHTVKNQLWAAFKSIRTYLNTHLK